MSGVNFLEKLLDGVDVEWKPLGEVGVFIRGNGLQKKDFVEEGFPAIHYGQIYTKYSLSAENTFSFVSNELANKLKQAKYNDLLLATTSENDEDVVKPLAWLGTSCRIPDDCIDKKRYPLFMARTVLQELIESLQSNWGELPC